MSNIIWCMPNAYINDTFSYTVRQTQRLLDLHNMSDLEFLSTFHISKAEDCTVEDIKVVCLTVTFLQRKEVKNYTPLILE